jgi:hypothetical protein
MSAFGDISSRDQAAEDSARTAHLIGKYLLIGLTYVDSVNELIRREQKHGEIVRVNRREGIVIRMDNGEEYALPPEMAALQPATPGAYRLKSNGDEIHDPDYISTWTITPPESQGN